MPRSGWPDEAVADIAARRDALRQAASLPGADLRHADRRGAHRARRRDRGARRGRPRGRRRPRRASRRRSCPSRCGRSGGCCTRSSSRPRSRCSCSSRTGRSGGRTTRRRRCSGRRPGTRRARRWPRSSTCRSGRRCRPSSPPSRGQASRGRPSCRILTADGPVDVTLTAAAADLPGDPPVLIVTAVRGHAAARSRRRRRRGKTRDRQAGEAAGGEGDGRRRHRGDDRRLDTVTAVTRVLLDNSTFSEAVTLQRCARLLAGEIADWVIIDIERGGRLLRQFAAGPRGGQADQVARVARGVDPDQESVPAAGARDRQVRAARAPRRPRRARPRARRHAAAA